MRVAVLADSHIDHGVFRSNAYDAWDAAVGWIIEHEVDLCVIAGDMFHRDKPDGIAVNRAGDSFKALTKAGVPVLVIVGNHEWIGAKPAGSGPCLHVETFRNLPKVKVMRKPDVIGIPGSDLVIAALPWPEPGKTAHDVAAEAGRLAHTIRNHDGPRIAIAHAAVSGATIKTKRGSEIDLWQFSDEPVVDLAEIDIPEAFTRTVLGHIHRRQELSDTCGYVGSTEAMSFADEGMVKGFSVFDWDDTTGTWEEQLIPVGIHSFLSIVVEPDGDIDSQLFALEEGTRVRLQVNSAASATDVARAKRLVRDLGGRIVQANFQPPETGEDDEDEGWEHDDALAHVGMSRKELLNIWYPIAKVPTEFRPHITELAEKLHGIAS